jgi:hypothetical protein
VILPMPQRSSRLFQEVVLRKSEKGDTKYGCVVAIRGVDSVVVGADFCQIGLSQVLYRRWFQRGSANNRPPGPENDTQTSRSPPLNHHFLQHLQHPRSSKETSLARVPAHATSTRQASRTFLPLHKFINVFTAIEPSRGVATGEQTSSYGKLCEGIRGRFVFQRDDTVGA